MFVFVYSAYHMKLSFLHLVVILTTLETPKNIFCFSNNMQNDNTARICEHYHESSDCFEYPENPYLNQATQKNTCQIFLPKKNRGIENFKPNKILRSSLSLEIQSIPLGFKVCMTQFFYLLDQILMLSSYENT